MSAFNSHNTQIYTTSNTDNNGRCDEPEPEPEPEPESDRVGW